MTEDFCIEDFRTSCCKAKPKRLGRANYVCSVCEKDVTMELMFVMDAVNESEKLKKKKNKS